MKVTKIDFVNPIPDSPIPKIGFQFNSFGSLQTPKVTAKKDKRNMPNGLPTISPTLCCSKCPLFNSVSPKIVKFLLTITIFGNFNSALFHNCPTYP